MTAWGLLCLVLAIALVPSLFSNRLDATQQSELIWAAADEIVEVDFDMGLIPNEVDCRQWWLRWFIANDSVNSPCTQLRFTPQSLRGPPSHRG